MKNDIQPVRHVCGGCIFHSSPAHGWGRFITEDNPSKTDLCAVCGDRAEGVEMPVYLNKWSRFQVLPTPDTSQQGISMELTAKGKRSDVSKYLRAVADAIDQGWNHATFGMNEVGKWGGSPEPTPAPLPPQASGPEE